MELTKQQLLNAGITLITPDCKIFKGDKPVKPVFHKSSGYWVAKLTSTWQIPLHRAVYVWYNDYIPDRLVVDHIDNKHSELLDNRLDNLQLISNRENSLKDKPARYLKANKNKSLDFYINKLQAYEKLLIETTDEYKKDLIRTNISNTKARINYYKKYYL